MPTEEIFRADAYARDCTATVIAVDIRGILLDRTVFYPTGGGQPGDTGLLKREDGQDIPIVSTVKEPGGDGVLHIPGEGAPPLSVGEVVTAIIDWDTRYKHMRMHTCMHLVCSLIEGDVTGGQVGAAKSRLDFNLEAAPDKEKLNADLNRLVAENHPVGDRWIDEAELDANPGLVRTMSVKPPRGSGKVRLIEVDGVDLQPCGGTHVKATVEIGPVRIGKIENKGRQNRRINILFAE
ncbi:MAG: alanyl-tRNA editing protein [Magnetospiraceae bacterium]